MKMCNTDFKIFSIPYYLLDDLEGLLKKQLEEYEKEAVINGVEVLRDIPDPYDDNGRVATFIVTLNKR